MKLITVENQDIRLNSFMDEMAFGKTNYDAIVKQEGLIAECDSISEEKYHFTFSPWSFSEIKSYDEPESPNPMVFYCGTNPLSASAKTLLQYYKAAGNPDSTKEDKDNMFLASYIICSIYTQAAVEGIEIPLNGAEGIMIDFSKEKPWVLFLPPNLFKYSSAGLPVVDAADAHGCWVNPTLIGLPSVCFARAVIAYKMLTGRYPYPASNSTERNADILDRKFLPLELSINGIDPILSKEVNKALKLNSNEVSVPGKKKKGKSSEDLTPTATFPLEILYKYRTEQNAPKLSDEAFAEKAKNYTKAQDAKINAKRKIRRNIATIVITAIVVTIVGIITGTSIKNNLDNYTSLGLTSVQTVEAYYKGVNTRDSVLMENISKGKNPRRFIDTVSQVYVIGKSRQAYAHDLGFVSPEHWLLYSTDAQKSSQGGIYGATNVKIDGKASEINPSLNKKKDKVPAVKEESGVTLTNDMTSVHNVEYYFIHSEGEGNDITVEKAFETFTLTYIKDRWIITNIEQNLFETNFNSFTFKNEYFYTVKQNDGDVIKTIQQLRDKYPWLPSKATLEREQIRLEEEANQLFRNLGY